jgi:hypothetical protein
MRKLILVFVVGLQAPVALGQSIDPPDCPIGYHCIPNDPQAVDPLSEYRRQQERSQCIERKQAEEQLLAGQAAMADPGNPYAVDRAIGTVDKHHRVRELRVLSYKPPWPKQRR